MRPQASFVRRRPTGRALLQIALASVALALLVVMIIVAIDYLNARWSRLAEVVGHSLALPAAPSAPHWSVNASANRQGPPSSAASDKRPAYR
jgi:hypothetical protein